MADGTSVTRGRKFAQMLAGARDVFLRDGFHGASVDDIARVAGVSKATIYAYVPDKRILFTEVLRAEFSALALQAELAIDPATPPAQALTAFARLVIDFHLTDAWIAIFRVCLAESGRFPEIGRAYVDSGPGDLAKGLVAYLSAAAARNELDVPDPAAAASQFLALCIAGYLTPVLLGLSPAPEAPDRAAFAQEAVATFLARYGPRG